ncbi:hypothetical protein VNO78_08487 [Psophocarpus tetragonolobus]|uniref:Uncharacterized protein n=1 Tax=Psophocarpus tetragonolobus TaxID=3891 RepID=A0AAN9XT13_PSOTE
MRWCNRSLLSKMWKDKFGSNVLYYDTSEATFANTIADELELVGDGVQTGDVQVLKSTMPIDHKQWFLIGYEKGESANGQQQRLIGVWREIRWRSYDGNKSDSLTRNNKLVEVISSKALYPTDIVVTIEP